MKRLDKRVAIITGGAQGIGQGIVERFAREGAAVVIWDVQTDKAQALAQKLSAEGLTVEVPPMTVDITKLDAAEAGAQYVAEKYGQIDILVNNAGIVRDASFKKMTAEQWQLVMDVNLTGVFNCTKAVSTYMMEANYGRIVSLSSVAGLFGNFGQTNYVAAKAGVAAMTKVWGQELGKNNITANAIAPGPIDTAMLATIPEEMLKGMVQSIPVRRVGTPADIAYGALFFCSEEAGFITGQTLIIDGGATLGL
ncbi:3-oxoacyl-ACP reductase FabG [Eisenibacter elegans]|uniref:3-oxoacyl-ACP reductase FabG n=1 Tax=Eisenibacter elegans TaxID=997 RepID=UPI0003FEAF77|nr:3-oxoacyl-ACP reductase FabG [Eisenibacter elegans]